MAGATVAKTPQTETKRPGRKPFGGFLHRSDARPQTWGGGFLKGGGVLGEGGLPRGGGVLGGGGSCKTSIIIFASGFQGGFHVGGLRAFVAVSGANPCERGLKVVQ